MQSKGNTTEQAARRNLSQRAAPSRRAALMLGVGVLALGLGCRVSPKGTPVAEQAVAVPFTAKSSLGELDLTAALGRGPLVLIFYRGHW